MKKLTVLFAVFAMIAMAMPVAADTQWDFYGSARVATYSVNVDLGDVGGVNNLNNAGDSSDTDTLWAVQGNSRIGANVKVSDTLSGRFEYGTGVNLRLLYGTWNFGAGALTAGQFYTPLATFISNQVYGTDSGMSDTGGLFGPGASRQQGLQLQFADFKVALLQATAYTAAEVAAAYGLAVDIDVTFPKIEMSYHLALGKAFLDFKAAYQTYDVETLTDTYDVDSYVVGLVGGVDIGKFYIKSNAWVGENVDSLVMLQSDAAPILNVAGNDLEDTDSYGLLLVVGAKINDMITLEAGIGYEESDIDLAGSEVDDTLAYYIQAAINLAPGVSITPEIGVIDLADSNVRNVDQGDTTYFGLKWMINF